jgi:hypothetical protein
VPPSTPKVPKEMVIQVELDAAVQRQSAGVTAATWTVPAAPLPETMALGGESVTLVQAGCWAKAGAANRNTPPAAARRTRPAALFPTILKSYI